MTAKEQLLIILQKAGHDFISACELTEKYIVEFKKEFQNNPNLKVLIYEVTINRVIYTLEIRRNS